jgi:predicted dehydrogenase
MTRKEFIVAAGTLSAGAALAPLLAETNPPSPSRRIKVGVIGCGSVSTQYLPHLSKSPHVELVCTCDIIPARAARRAEEYNVPHHFPNIHAMLEGPSFELFVNLTDMQEHGRLNALALEAGRHVWSEKPMANTYREGLALLDFARARQRRIWAAPAVVNSPQFAFMAHTLNAGKLGKVAGAHGNYGHLGPEWSAFFYEEGGGCLPDLAVYNLATLTGLLGPVKSVVAMLNILTPTRVVENRPEPIRVEAEDNAMVLMEHASGALSQVQSGFNYFDPYGHGGSGQTKATISIVGTAGNMQLIGYDWAPAGVELRTKDRTSAERVLPDPGSYVWQEGATVIAECLATGREPLITPEHALHVLEIIEAARASQETGRRIQLESNFKWPVVTGT